MKVLITMKMQNWEMKISLKLTKLIFIYKSTPTLEKEKGTIEWSLVLFGLLSTLHFLTFPR